MTTRRLPPTVSRSQTTTAERRATIIPRRFLRATVNLSAQYSIGEQIDWHDTTIDDLGGGGVRLQTAEDIAAGTVLALRFSLDTAPITATARVAMSFFDKTRACYVHGAAFTAIDPAQQETIVQHIVALQLAQTA